MKGSLIRLIAPVLAFAGLSLLPGAVRADFLFYTSVGAFNAGLSANGLSDTNLLFNGAGDILGPATTITGNLNNAANNMISIQGIENLVGNGGQARVEAQDGEYTTANFFSTDPAFVLTSLIVNVNTASRTNGSIRLTALNQFGGTDFLDIAAAPGSNFIGVIAINGQTLNQATVSLIGNTLGSISDIRQIRIGIRAVPEPSSLALMGLGLTSTTVVGLRRRGRKIVA